MARVKDSSGNFPNGVQGKDAPIRRLLVSKTFSGTGTSDAFEVRGSFNIDINGSTASVISLERSFDGGATWNILSRDTAGNLATWTDTDISLTLEEVEDGVKYRFNCTTHTGGTPVCRASRT